jgi:hypothetical protein
MNGSMASPAAIKEALCTHGPVVAAVYATRDFQMYTGGVFNQFEEGNGASSINHDVLIIGWDNIKDAWLIKNSWDTSWGDGGFMWIRYRSNWIGYGAAWVDAVKVTSVGAANDIRRGLQLNSNAINSIVRGFSSEIFGDKPSPQSLKRALGKRAPE